MSGIGLPQSLVPDGGGGGDAAGQAGMSALGMLGGPWGMAAMVGLQAVMGAKKAKQEAAARKAQWEQKQFQARMQNQRQNRAIAKKNAMQWMQNKKIAESANRQRAETEFYLRYNYDNETGQLSRQIKQNNDNLIQNLHRRGMDPKSGTGRALMQQVLSTNTDTFKNRRITHENAMLGAQRQQDAALAQRNFGYNAHIPFMGGKYTGTDPSTIFTQSLVAGLGRAGMAGIQTGVQDKFRSDILSGLKDQP